MGGVGGERGPLLCICFSFFSFLFFSVFQVFLQECLNHLISVEGKPSPDPKLRFEPGDLERKRFLSVMMHTQRKEIPKVSRPR